MRILLDENLPKRLKRDFHEHEIYTVNDKKWSGLSNGELLGSMVSGGFDALITFDKNLQHQQNFEKYPITVIVLTAVSNQHKHLVPLVEMIRTELSRRTIGITVIGA